MAAPPRRKVDQGPKNGFKLAFLCFSCLGFFSKFQGFLLRLKVSKVFEKIRQQERKLPLRLGVSLTNLTGGPNVFNYFDNKFLFSVIFLRACRLS